MIGAAAIGPSAPGSASPTYSITGNTGFILPVNNLGGKIVLGFAERPKNAVAAGVRQFPAA